MATQTRQHKDPIAQKLAGEAAEAAARLDLMKAQAEARKAKEDMHTISGLAAMKEKVVKAIGEMQREMAEDREATKRQVQQDLQALKDGLDRLGQRYEEWDEAAERRFNARLDGADARLAIWKAHTAQKQAEEAMRRHDALATLEEKIALARARAAEARHQKFAAKAQVALRDAAADFDAAYEAAVKRYEKK